MVLFLFIGTVVLCTVIGLLIYARWNYGTLEKMGIPVVPHHPIVGSTADIYKYVGALKDVENMKKFGPIFGVYEGREPQVFICDPELVRQICTKDAEYFNSKRDIDFIHPVVNEVPDFVPLEKWKLLRSLLTPVFSSAKLKLISLPMREATMDLAEEFKANIRKSGSKVYENLAVDEAVHSMITDLVCRCFYSIRICDPNDENNQLSKIAKDIWAPPSSSVPVDIVILSHTFPILRKILGISAFPFDKQAVDDFVVFFKRVLEERKKNNVKKNDVVNLCMEWYEMLDTPEFKSAQMTELTILCQALVFFTFAQDQISSIIGVMLYHMIKDDEMEKKIYEEIDTVFARHDGNIEYENVSELGYLNACLNESLRLYPSFYRLERLCTKDWKNERFGLNIKKGQAIQMPIWAINRNPDFVENPEEFNPERWLSDDKEKLNAFSAYFGHGPRTCAAKRFATVVMPIITAYLLKELKFLVRKDTELKFISGGPFMTLHNPIYVDVVERFPKQ